MLSGTITLKAAHSACLDWNGVGTGYGLRGCKYLYSVVAISLGAVHRGVGPLQEVIARGGISIRDGDAR